MNIRMDACVETGHYNLCAKCAGVLLQFELVPIVPLISSVVLYRVMGQCHFGQLNLHERLFDSEHLRDLTGKSTTTTDRCYTSIQRPDTNRRLSLSST